MIRKRKHPDTENQPLHALYIDAYEADIVRDKEAAASLEIGGSALIAMPEVSPPVWVDRYDARLLLDPQVYTKLRSSACTPAAPPPRPSSPSGWSDLPSDTEDTFFFTPDQAEDYHRGKRRRLMEQAHEQRLRARLEEDGDAAPPTEDVWGASDEEPDPPTTLLMSRTAAHLLSSPNPAQLEMRILANHGADRRFAFLRGRWKRAWGLAKARARIEKEEKERKTEGMGGLVGYGSDDEDEDKDKEKEKEVAELPGAAAPQPKTELPDVDKDEEAKREAKRKRLKEWRENRAKTKV